MRINVHSSESQLNEQRNQINRQQALILDQENQIEEYVAIGSCNY
jgi:hypothetical protein